MPSHKLLAPFALLALVFLYLAWEVDPSYARFMIPCVVVAAAIYVSAPQINWWWWQRHAPDLEPQFHQWLERNCLFYSNLPTERRPAFRSRVFLIREATDWSPMAWPEENVPADVQLAIASQQAMLSFGWPRFLNERFEKIIVYPRPFLSPNHPQPHASELFEPDGCLIFSAEQILLAAVMPKRFFNPALYELARALVLGFPSEGLPAFADVPEIWEKLEQASGQSRQRIAETIWPLEPTGALDAQAVAVHHFFIFGAQFAEAFPTESAQMRAFFGD